MIEKLVTALERIDAKLSALSEHQDALSKRVDDIANRIDAPGGFVALKGSVDVSKEELQQMINGRDTIHMEALSLEFAFSNALYIGLMPRHKEQLEELLSEAHLGCLRKTLDAHRRLESLVAGASENSIKKAIERLDAAIESARSIGERASSELLRVEQAAEKHMKVEAHVKSLVDAKVEKAMERLECAVSEAKALTAKASNALAVGGKASRSIYSVRKT